MPLAVKPAEDRASIAHRSSAGKDHAGGSDCVGKAVRDFLHRPQIHDSERDAARPAYDHARTVYRRLLEESADE
jgi:hypothetical protein